MKYDYNIMIKGFVVFCFTSISCNMLLTNVFYFFWGANETLYLKRNYCQVERQIQG